MDASIIQKLTDLIATLKGEGKTDLVKLATTALTSLQGGDIASGMASLLDASKLDERFKQFLGENGEKAAQIGSIAKAAGGLLGKFV